MSVYVDRAIYPYRRMIMCHMVADSLEELHAMADSIGVARRWFQSHSSTPHYDLCKSKRALAVQNGAIELNTIREAADTFARLREKRDAL